MIRTIELALCSLLVVGAAASAAAQAAKPWTLACEHKYFDNDYYRCTGQVVFIQGTGDADTKVYADDLEWFSNEDRAIVTGNVVFRQGRNQISAERAEFNTKTQLGTFYNAQGIANIVPPRPARPAPGAFVPPPVTGNQDTDVYFFGDTVEKAAPKKYLITNGGFTTCVQPAPRWNLHAGRITLNVDDYALLFNSVFNVKGVPLLYLPVVYYPTNKENRSTGFLLPTYGSSNLNGKTIGNQFFWAIDRSQDATLMHDWYSKRGQGVGAEYRYNIGSGSGALTTYMLNSRSTADSPAERSFNLVGGGSQQLPYRLRARADVNYFSSLSTNQTFKTDVNDFSRSQRTYGGNIAGSWGRYSLNGTFQRSETFSSASNSTLTGSSPLLAVSGGEQPLFAASPIYFSFASDYAHLDHQTLDNDAVTDDRTLSRFNVAPRLRYPLKRWQWLTINSSLEWRDTFYSRSQDPMTSAVINDSLNRSIFTVQTNLLGPTVSRVWDTPGDGYAEKFKHTIEPFLNIAKTTSADDFGRVVTGVDTPSIGTLRYDYGVNNRLYAKRKFGAVSQSQEIATLAIGQSYYTNPRAAQIDPNFQTSFSGSQPSNFSPVKVDLRLNPSTRFGGDLHAEIDPTHREFRSLSVTARHNWSAGGTSASWSQTFLIKGLTGFDNPAFVNRSLNVSTNAHTTDNHVGGTYGLTFDAVRSMIIQQSVQAYYSAQCCGVALQYSQRNLPSFVLGPSNNNTFLISFTLAGIGSFSPFSAGANGLPH